MTFKRICKITILTIIGIIFIFTTGFAQKFLMLPNGANFYIYRNQSRNFIIHRSKLVRWKLHENFSKLASAKRITSAADDPAGLAVAEAMNSAIQGLKREAMNAEDYRNYLKYAEAAIGQNQSILNRVRLLILRSSSGIMGPDDRALNQSEIDQLISQIDMNAKFSSFNKKLVVPSLTANNLGIDKVDVVRNLYGSMKLVENAQTKLRRMRTLAGVRSNVLAYEIKGKYYRMVNIQSSESRIRDLNMAEEITGMMKNNVIMKSQYGVFLKAK